MQVNHMNYYNDKRCGHVDEIGVNRDLLLGW